MQNKAWNQYSSSSDSNAGDENNDSWFDDEEKPETTKDQKQPTNKQAEKQDGKVEQQPAQAKNEEPKTRKTQNKEGDKQKKYEKRTFLTDQELLKLYVAKQVDDPKVIKATNCRSEQSKQIIKGIKTKRTVQLLEGLFLLVFETEEDLVNFVKSKIEKRFKFYLQQYYDRRKDQTKNAKSYGRDQNQGYRNREDNRQRQRKPKRYRETEQKEHKKDQKRENPQTNQTQKIRPKKRYQKQQDSDKQEASLQKEQDEKKQNKKNEKQQQKVKKVYLLKEYFEIPENTNKLNITSESFQIARVLGQLQNKKVFKNFNRIYLTTPLSALKKVAQLCNQLSIKKKFHLQKEPPLQVEKQAIIQLTLIENGNTNKTQTLNSRFKPKVQRVEQSHLRLLGTNSEDYFKCVEKYNLSEIVKGFDQNKYINLLREMSQSIQKSWGCWKIQAEEENIEVLLKLANRIKKSTFYDLELKPSLRNEKALLTAQLKQRPQKDRRPKVDVSNVNHYLS